eukprot:TRINITY_DN113611_c0_g1_i1.p1 TRINITY_DN113611_c0_g1~~TRINITY_DN113611_c0_g1_i1.p1  ORF type:complete len:418 (+),score=74.11 TRINITY_DN113611_c0_g1_i1:288-1541(+)
MCRTLAIICHCYCSHFYGTCKAQHFVCPRTAARRTVSRDCTRTRRDRGPMASPAEAAASAAMSTAACVAIVTGGACGIGRAIAEALLERDSTVHVFVADVEASELETLKQADGGAGKRLSTFELDVTSEDSVLAAKDRILAALPAILPSVTSSTLQLVLFNNAGIQFDVPMFFNPSMADRFVRLKRFHEDIRPEMARKTLAVNFVGAVRVLEDLFVPVADFTKNDSASQARILDVRCVVTASGAGRLNLGRLLKQHGSDCVLAQSVLNNDSDIGKLKSEDMEQFIADYEATTSEMLSEENSGDVAFPVYGRKHGYYLSSYGFSKALLHQALRIKAKEVAQMESAMVFCGAFPGVIRTRMNENFKEEDAMPGPPRNGAEVLLRLGLDKPRAEILQDNSNGFCLYNPKLETVKEYWEAC